ISHLSRGARDLPVHLAPQQPVWRVAPKKFIPIVSFALLITGLLQLGVYQTYGGILGYIARYEEALQVGDTLAAPEGFRGMGILFTVSESFPIVAMIAFTLYATRSKVARSCPVLVGALLVYFLLLLLFGGLRGSRSNTIYSLFWGVGMIHVLVRPISRKMIAVGCIFVIGFMYLYSFYKEAGLKAVTLLQEGASTVEMERKTRRTLEGAILGDLGRSDIQAFLLYRLWPTPVDYEYAWGRTYVGAMALVIPRSIWPERPATKVKEGTEALYGRGSHKPELWESSHVYGLAGEAILNFGVLSAPLAFLVLGLVMKAIRGFFAALDRQDIRLLMLPFMVIFVVDLLTGDSDNLLWFVVKYGMVPFFVIMSGSARSFKRSSSPVDFPVRHRLVETAT
ncbi:MAG: hypothetical protein C4293_01300, partial [Nitrospiraceae bacterium]